MTRPGRLAFVLILICVAATSFGFDVGGYLDNTSGYRSPPVGGAASDGLVQRTTLALWMRHEFGEWTLDATGSYTYTPLFPLILDVDHLTLSADIVATEAGATTLEATFGRARYVDFTRNVLDHTLDGLKLQIDRGTNNFRFDLATSALVITPRYRIVEVATAESGQTGDETQEERVRLIGPPGLVVGFEYRLLEALAGQDLTFAANALQDLRRDSAFTPVGTELFDPTAVGRFDRQYLTAGVGGSLAPGLFHRTYYVLNTGSRLDYVPDSGSGTGSSYQYEPVLAHMAGTELTWFLPDVMSSRARLFGLYSSGETERSEVDDRFVPISASAYSDVFSLQPGNSAHVGLSYSMRPLADTGSDVLQTELRSVTYFRSTGGGAVSEPGVDPTTTGAYVGTDANLVVTVLPFSDLRIVLRGGVFLPNANVMGPNNDTVDYQATLQGVLRF